MNKRDFFDTYLWKKMRYCDFLQIVHAWEKDFSAKHRLKIKQKREGLTLHTKQGLL